MSVCLLACSVACGSACSCLDQSIEKSWHGVLSLHYSFVPGTTVVRTSTYEYIRTYNTYVTQFFRQTLLKRGYRSTVALIRLHRLSVHTCRNSHSAKSNLCRVTPHKVILLSACCTSDGSTAKQQCHTVLLYPVREAISRRPGVFKIKPSSGRQSHERRKPTKRNSPNEENKRTRQTAPHSYALPTSYHSYCCCTWAIRLLYCLYDTSVYSRMICGVRSIVGNNQVNRGQAPTFLAEFG